MGRAREFRVSERGRVLGICFEELTILGSLLSHTSPLVARNEFQKALTKIHFCTFTLMYVSLKGTYDILRCVPPTIGIHLMVLEVGETVYYTVPRLLMLSKARPAKNQLFQIKLMMNNQFAKALRRDVQENLHMNFTLITIAILCTDHPSLSSNIPLIRQCVLFLDLLRVRAGGDPVSFQIYRIHPCSNKLCCSLLMRPFQLVTGLESFFVTICPWRMAGFEIVEYSHTVYQH